MADGQLNDEGELGDAGESSFLVQGKLPRKNRFSAMISVRVRKAMRIRSRSIANTITIRARKPK